MNLTIDEIKLPENDKLALEDKWLLNEFNSLCENVVTNLDNFEVGVALASIYGFAWDIFCDWYIELAKARLNEKDTEANLVCQNVIAYVLEGILKLLHPFMPFITEEIYQALPHDAESIMISEYPNANDALVFTADAENMTKIIDAIKAIRTRRSEMNVPPSKKAKVYIATSYTDSFNQKLIDEIADLKDMLQKENRIRTLIRKQLREVEKKYGQDRLTDLMQEDDVVVITKDELIDDYNLRVFLTKEGYFKKIPLTALRSSPEQKLKDGDEITQEIEWHNKSDILFFSDRQTVYKMKLYEMSDSKAGSLGDFLPNLLEMDEDEHIIFMTVTDNYGGELLLAFENGKVARVPLEAYATKTNRKKLINAYSEVSPIVDIIHLSVSADVTISSSNDRLITVNAQVIPLKTTKSTQGVQALASPTPFSAAMPRRLMPACGI